LVAFEFILSRFVDTLKQVKIEYDAMTVHVRILSPGEIREGRLTLVENEVELS
jgi:hypothetical protein